MTILIGAAEMNAFATDFGIAGFSTDTDHYDSTYSRGAITLPSNTEISKSFTTSTDVWVHDFIFADIEGTGTGFLIQILSGSTAILRLGGNEQVDFEYFNGSIWVAIATDVLLHLRKNTIDIKCKIDASVGEFSIYINNELKGTFTGDTTVSGESSVDKITLGGMVSSGTFAHHSQIIVADTITIGAFAETIAMTADGDNTAWTGTFADIDDIGINDDGTFISSTSAGDLEDFVASDITLPTNYSIAAVVMNARTRRGATGPQGMQIIERQSATDYFGSDQTLNLGFEPKQEVFSVDLDTSVQWTQAGVNSAKFGVRSRP